MISYREPEGGFKSFWEFYAFYLHQHLNVMNRRLHIYGTLFGLFSLIVIVFLRAPFYAYLLPLVIGYGHAWVGHFFFGA